MLTVEELAATTGETVRTIRFYQSEGVLPPPERHGREARYDEDHVKRLRTISELQRRGLRLAAIRELLQHAPHADAPEFLGLGATLSDPWSEDRPIVLDEDALLQRIGEFAEVRGAIEALMASNLVERRGDTVPVVYFVPSPGLLDIAIEAIRAGLSPFVASRLQNLMTNHIRALATDLVAEFTELVSIGHLAEQGPEHLAQLLTELRPITRRSVDLLFAHAMEQAQRGLLEAATGDDAANPATPAPATPHERNQ